MSAAPPRTTAPARRNAAAPIVLGVAGSFALGAVILAFPAYGPLTAGMVLLAIGFAVMAPCSIQMALTMSRMLAGMAPGSRAGVRRGAGLFAAGYLALYLPFALALGALTLLLDDAAWVAVAAGALVALALGLAALGAMPLGALSRCRGPLWLLRSGRASFRRPVRAGFAFGQYCATCCGPYILAVAVLAGGSERFAVGAGLVFAYAILMVLPFLAPAILAPEAYSRLGAKAGRLAPRTERATGIMLVGLSLALVPSVVAAAVS
ncbi:hypothetical protein GCG21_02120 [Pseudactinotalea sp. HY160]|uniref:copper chaperone n=1 Tax=Pseudactinotalea sp. HY160 TaxID=2654490 RepID=UPI00128C7428|nr:cytochrome c biogenesis protein CcdA [Pseudactinotalea sp. HY160]MPV48824.1 hypothetical protein [Pseudactinotalea sp. HY160]